MLASVLVSSSLGFLGGVFIASIFSIPPIIIYFFFIITPFLLTVFWKDEKVRYISLFAIFFILGIFRLNTISAIFFENENAEHFPIHASIEVEILEIENRDAIQILVVRPALNINLHKDIKLKDQDRIRVVTDKFTTYSVGEFIILQGDIERPKNFTEDFNWIGYLAKEGIGYIMNKPFIEKTNKHPIGSRAIIFKYKKMLEEGINQSLLPPDSSLYKAMVIGDKADLTNKDRETLQRAGLSHIVAISGMHIAILVLVLISFFVSMGLWRHHALYAALSILILYILLIGAPASASRAGIMATIAILAERMGRPNSSWRALLFAATIMVALNPLLLRHDIGFQLSYLAVLGILMFSDKVHNLVNMIFSKSFSVFFSGHITKDRPIAISSYSMLTSGITGIISITIAAQIFTLPLVIYHFGYASPWSVVSNLMVLPVLSYTLGAGVFMAVLGRGGGIITTIASMPAWIFSKYIWFVASLF
ncbi:MAG: ComEC/Rec2 family competence protein [Candidatus Spechtbacterales bacterium]|nr:ComEC/Rec2 family competence protein [Candidatus Spechtbacterales bacterium]